MTAAVTARERMIVSAGLVLLVLLVLAGARLVTLLPATLDAAPDAALVNRLVVEKTLPATWYEPAMRFLALHHRTVSGLVFVVGVLGMLLRTGVSLRTLDFLYNDSERAERRGFLALLIDALSVTAQLALIISMTAAMAGRRPDLAPVLLALLLLVNGTWLFWLGMRRRGEERDRLRGLWRAGLLSLLFAAGLAAYLGCCGVGGASAEAAEMGMRSAHACVAGVAMILLCVSEVYVQTATYSRRRGKAFARHVAGLVLALLLLGLAANILYEQFDRTDSGTVSGEATPESTRP